MLLFAPEPAYVSDAQAELVLAGVLAIADAAGRIIRLHHEVRQGEPIDSGGPHTYLIPDLGGIRRQHLLLRIIIL